MKVDAGTLNNLYAGLLRDGRRDRPGGLSPRTVRYVHTILHRALKDAVKWGRLARNPADGANPPRATSSGGSEMRTWTASELRCVLEHVETDRLYAAWLMSATTGMRRGEVLGLRWQDVDLEAGTASCRRTVITIAKQVRFGTPKTPRGDGRWRWTRPLSSP